MINHEYGVPVPRLTGVARDVPDDDLMYFDKTTLELMVKREGNGAVESVVGDIELADLPVGTVDVYSSLSEEIDSRIRGRTANDASKLIYSVLADNTATRSATCWAADLDLSCVAFWQSASGFQIPVTAITARHAVTAWHAAVPAGTTVRWLDTVGAVVERTVTSSVRVGTTDINLLTLSADLPATVTPARVLPATPVLDLTGAPLLGFDQDREAIVKVIANLDNAYIPFVNSGFADAQHAAFHEPWVGGDSGSPVFTVLDGRPVLLGIAFSATATSNPIASVVAAIEALLGGATIARATLPVSQFRVPFSRVTGLGTAASKDAAVAAVAGQVPLVGDDGKISASLITTGSTTWAEVQGAVAGTNAVIDARFSAQVVLSNRMFLNYIGASGDSAARFYSTNALPLEVACYDPTNTVPIAQFLSRDGDGTTVGGMAISNNGTLSWYSATAKATTRTNLFSGLPTSNPGGSGLIWNDGGTLKIT